MCIRDRLIDMNDKEQEMFHLKQKEDLLGINIFENPIFPEEMKSKLDVYKRQVRVNVRPPNCCNKLIYTDGNLLPWPNSGGVIPPRQRYAITATIIRLAKESANLYCCLLYTS